MSTATATPTVADLRALGFALTRPDPGEKKPTYTGWSTRSREPADFGPDDLVGILNGPLSDCNSPGHGLVTIDLDTIDALEKADRFLPVTRMEEGRPGKERDHRSYLVPLASVPVWAESAAKQGAAAARKAKGHPGPAIRHFGHAETMERVIDFLGTGSQHVCPGGPSPRQWVGGRPGEPAVVDFLELWDATCKLAVACGCKLPFTADDPPPAGAIFHGKAGGDLERRVLAYLEKCDPAVSRKNGHSGTLWPARVVCWGFALDEDEGLRILRDHFNPRCVPPWSEAELRHKIHDAATLPFNKPRGWLLNEDRPGPGKRARARRGGGSRNGDGNHDPPPDHDQADAGNPADPIRLSDLGNARRLIRRHGEDLRHCHPWRKWLCWDGTRWALDATAATTRRYKETITTLFREAEQQIVAIRKELEADQ